MRLIFKNSIEGKETKLLDQRMKARQVPYDDLTVSLQIRAK